MLDTLYARLRRCGNALCVSGRPVVEHNLFPDLSHVDGGRFERWQRIAGVIREAIRSGELAPGTELPSTRTDGARRTASRCSAPCDGIADRGGARSASTWQVSDCWRRPRPGRRDRTRLKTSASKDIRLRLRAGPRAHEGQRRVRGGL
jgi:hypothetical protein